MSTGYPGAKGRNDKNALRWRLPYGRWLTKSGREILHDRAYRPLIERHQDGSLHEGDINEFVHDVAVEGWSIYTDETDRKEMLKRALAALAEWGPQATAMGMEIAQRRLDEACHWERARRRSPFLPPPWESNHEQHMAHIQQISRKSP
jgi:hypothetical protein